MPNSETKEKQWMNFYERLKILKSTRGESLI
jgi:hypothetical protein